MLEYMNISMMDTQVPVEKVDLLHFDPFNPDGRCCCGGNECHCSGKHCHCHCNGNSSNETSK